MISVNLYSQKVGFKDGNTFIGNFKDSILSINNGIYFDKNVNSYIELKEISIDKEKKQIFTINYFFDNEKLIKISITAFIDNISFKNNDIKKMIKKFMKKIEVESLDEIDLNIDKSNANATLVLKWFEY